MKFLQTYHLQSTPYISMLFFLWHIFKKILSTELTFIVDSMAEIKIFF